MKQLLFLLLKCPLHPLICKVFIARCPTKFHLSPNQNRRADFRPNDFGHSPRTVPLFLLLHPFVPSRDLSQKEEEFHHLFNGRDTSELGCYKIRGRRQKIVASLSPSLSSIAATWRVLISTSDDLTFFPARPTDETWLLCPFLLFFGGGDFF